MKKILSVFLVPVFALFFSLNAKAESLTLGWAAWDPANALQELSKEFTAETGIDMNFEFVPWTSFADRMLNELNNQGKTFDLLIGDSQWIGAGATYGHYVKLNDFFDANGISMDDFNPATVYAYSTWPKGTPNYYALPAMGDALAWAYRKDWFDRPELQAEFKSKHGYDLGVPKTWDELYDMCSFFQGREIDGVVRYGAAINTERGSEGITMGVTAAMYAWGMEYEDPNNPYSMDGYFNSAEAAEAVEFYRKMYEDGLITEHSVGIIPVKEAYDETRKANVMRELRLFEFSSVTFGANENTPVVDIKSMSRENKKTLFDKFEKLMKAMKSSSYTDSTFELMEIELERIKSLIINSEPQESTQKDNEPIDFDINNYFKSLQKD